MTSANPQYTVIGGIIRAKVNRNKKKTEFKQSIIIIQYIHNSFNQCAVIDLCNEVVCQYQVQFCRLYGTSYSSIS